MRATLQRSIVKILALIIGPEGVLELVLDVEQPDANRSCQDRDRQGHKQERTNADQIDHRGDQNRDCNVRRHCT